MFLLVLSLETVVNTADLERPVGSALEPLIRKLEYRSHFSPADRNALLNLPHRVKAVENHEYIVRERDEPTYCCLMMSGFSVRHKIVGTGLRQIVAIHMKGELVDLQNSMLGIADHSVQMLTAGQVAMIPREEVLRLAFERPLIGKALWIDTLVDGSIFREWIANVGRRNARTRVAHLLCEFGLRLKQAGLADENDYQLPMTQEQLADATGLTAVHVSRSLKRLEADGLIQRCSPRTVTIGDWKRLANAGDFDRAYLHMPENDTEFPEHTFPGC